MPINYEIPVKTVSEANRRGNWRKHESRRKTQRETAELFTRQWVEGLPDPPLRITLTRLCPKGIKDDDNLRSSMKAVRDGIADAIGIDDGDKRLKWCYDQQTRKEYGVGVMIERGSDGNEVEDLRQSLDTYRRLLGQAQIRHAEFRHMLQALLDRDDMTKNPEAGSNDNE